MSLLISINEVNMQNIDRYPVHRAIAGLNSSKIAKRLQADPAALSQFQAVAKWHNQFSHGTLPTIATSQNEASGAWNIGADYDLGKESIYRTQIRLRTSAASFIADIALSLCNPWMGESPPGK